MKTFEILLPAYVVLLAAMTAGWVNNLIWVIENFSDLTGQTIVALIGILIVPVGAIHGIYLWF